MSRLALAVVAALLLVVPSAEAGTLRAGAAKVDGTYHVGSSAGQYASTRDGGYGEFDPHVQQGKNQASYGVQSRLSIRAVVLQEDGGDKLAIVKVDNYIPQDMLWRRAAQLLEAKGIGIGKQNLTMTVTHDHSSPYYTSTAWGAWAFQDVLDVRFFDWQARSIARAVEQANARLETVRVSLKTGSFDKLHKHSFGPAVADDGTPAGYPESDAEHRYTVMRIDRAVGRKRFAPLATLLNYSGHPEMLEGNDLLSADYVGALERMVDRRTGGMLLFTQNAVGTAEPERSKYHSIHERLEFDHRQYGQMETAAKLLADAVVGTWDAIGAQRGGDGQTLIPWMSNTKLDVEDRWFPGPLSHPYAGVSNCRTDAALNGQPGIPVVGLPDCNRDVDVRPVFGALPFDPALTTDDAEALGVPVPENYSAPGYSGLEETLGIHLQAFRLGDVLFTMCSCEQWKDQARNIQTRTDRVAGNEHLGYLWPCEPADSLACRRMRAQVLNDAAGWDAPEYAPFAESEPADPSKIKGNYTHDDTAEHARFGYALTVPIAMANDYNGYIATYREYQRGDHYRKALTAWGPHSSDYLATRLVRMGRSLAGDDASRAAIDDELLRPKEDVNQAHADAKATAIGSVASATAAAYAQTIADDAGAPSALDQPASVVQRFSAATFRWRGGDNYVDNPEVRVERRAGSRWVPFADQSGEVVTTVAYPALQDAASAYTSSHEWRWTATFEAFVSRIGLVSPAGEPYRATPAGEYRFVVRGARRSGGADVPYSVASKPFEVQPWDGVTVAPAGLLDGRPAFAVGPSGVRSGTLMKEGDAPVSGAIAGIDYPDSYTAPLRPRFIRDGRSVVRDPDAPADASRWEWYCLDCSFRPWLDRADPAEVVVTIRSASGRVRKVNAELVGDKWVAPVTLAPGDDAFVAAGGVRDAWGNFNGAPSPPTTG